MNSFASSVASYGLLAIAINATKNDRLIYALYELNEEEISIVEGK